MFEGITIFFMKAKMFVLTDCYYYYFFRQTQFIYIYILKKGEIIVFDITKKLNVTIHAECFEMFHKQLKLIFQFRKNSSKQRF